MNNTHAVVEAGGSVERLTDAPDLVSIGDGQALVALAATVFGWPTGAGALHCSEVGELYWVDQRSVTEAKASKRAQINAWRLEANRTTFPFDGKQIACDELSRGDIDFIQGYVSRNAALPAGFPGAWKAVDNTYILVPDVATWDSIFNAMGAQGTSNFMYAQSLKAQLEAAQTLEEIDAIVW